MDIYIADISPLSDERTFFKYYSPLPNETKKRIDRFKRNEDRMRSLGGYILVSHGLELRNASLSEVRTDDFGKPYIEGSSFHFNISHSATFAAAVFSDFPVGTDIEAPKKVNLRIAEHFFAEREKNIIKNAQNSELEFLRIWTKKEAFAKACGFGTLQILKKDIASPKSLSINGIEYIIDTISANSYILSVAHAANEPMSPITHIRLI